MPIFKRHDGRRAAQMRPFRLTPDFLPKADGSCLIEAGATRVICTACFVPGVPAWLRGKGSGWVTAEYGMLPAAGGGRKTRPIGKPDGRAVEIQRLIGRVARGVVRTDKLGENTVYLDCDVLEADGGTRTSAITGSYVALFLAIRRAAADGRCSASAITGQVAAVSVGMVGGRAMLDLDYAEDSAADVDMNVAMLAGGKFIDVQASAERQAFDARALGKMLLLARKGIRELLILQRKAISRGEKT